MPTGDVVLPLRGDAAGDGPAGSQTPPKWRWTVGLEFPWWRRGDGQIGVRYLFLEDGVCNSLNWGGAGGPGKLDLLTYCKVASTSTADKT